MINFPVLESLTVSGYGLYPISLEKPFVADFSAGPTVIVGVNGSGKTTLISMALRCLTGPYDLPASNSDTELGQVRPRPVALDRTARQVFARRVADGAGNASVQLTVSVANKRIVVERRLSDLSLISLHLGDARVDLSTAPASEDAGRTPADEARFQQTLADAIGVGTFFDVLIILRFLVFMLEDRRALVWDPSAQRQIFRVLMLPPERAAEYANAQQAVISADSAVRNTRALITRHQKQRQQVAKRASVAAAAEVQRRLKAAESDAIRDKMIVATEERGQADAIRAAARLDRLRAEESRESSARELERIRMEALKHWLEPSQDTARYIIGHLLSDQRCLVCGTDPSPVAEEIAQRLREGVCPICGSRHTLSSEVVPVSAVDSARIKRLEEEIELADQQVSKAEEQLEIAQKRLAVASEEYVGLETARIRVDRALLDILRQIPSDRLALGTVEDDIDVLERIVKEDLETQRQAETRFGHVVAEAVARVQLLQEQIASSFASYLQLFLREDASLVYQTIRARVGQAGAAFDFPAFRLSMSGGAVAGQTIRDQPNAVSQSQAEFVDLAFRMALMSVASKDSPASLVVDAPEASLDFLFARRAGMQLAAFSWAHPQNRVIVTSYLPSENLVNSFLERIPSKADREARVVDLIKFAAPNAALRSDREEYEIFLEKVLDGGASPQ